MFSYRLTTSMALTFLNSLIQYIHLLVVDRYVSKGQYQGRYHSIRLDRCIPTKNRCLDWSEITRLSEFICFYFFSLLDGLIYLANDFENSAFSFREQSQYESHLCLSKHWPYISWELPNKFNSIRSAVEIMALGIIRKHHIYESIQLGVQELLS